MSDGDKKCEEPGRGIGNVIERERAVIIVERKCLCLEVEGVAEREFRQQ